MTLQELAEAWRFVLGTPVRSGELAPIERTDINWEAKQLRVRAETSKSRRERTIPLRDDLLWILHRQRQRNLAQGYCGPLVFTSPTGKPWDRTGTLAHAMKPSLGEAGLDEAIDVHCLRHTAATLMLSRGAGLEAVQTILGHATATTTLGVYGHAVADRETEAVNLIPVPGGEDRSQSARMARVVGE